MPVNMQRNVAEHVHHSLGHVNAEPQGGATQQGAKQLRAWVRQPAETLTCLYPLLKHLRYSGVQSANHKERATPFAPASQRESCTNLGHRDHTKSIGVSCASQLFPLLHRFIPSNQPINSDHNSVPCYCHKYSTQQARR